MKEILVIIEENSRAQETVLKQFEFLSKHRDFLQGHVLHLLHFFTGLDHGQFFLFLCELILDTLEPVQGIKQSLLLKYP